ncbi:MAG: hypothetical protein OXH97_07950 [Chloroflexota bacterium]|nr:hypothetical protein [Chloroflexota bacterium]
MSELAVTFDDMTVLTEGGADVFVVNLNETNEPPPYYVEVGGRRFSFDGSTFLIFGHSAVMPQWVREHEAEGRLVLLGERDDRYLRYVHDPAEEMEEDEEE